MISNRPLFFKSSSIFIYPLGIVPGAPITIGITFNIIIITIIIISLLVSLPTNINRRFFTEVLSDSKSP